MSFRNYFSFFGLFIFIRIGIAQQNVIIKVIDENGLPIEGVTAQSEKNKFLFEYSDVQGILKISLRDIPDSIHLNHLNYVQYVFEVSDTSLQQYSVTLGPKISVLEQTEIVSSWVNDQSFVVHSTLNIDKINRNYLAQDVPYLLQHLPSTYSTSDAGNGIGYTGIRIRGLDPTQINVLINGVALNDGESQSVYWVDLPDVLASASEIQVQRGIGLSDAGQVAFGSSILINTNRLHSKPFLQLESAAGSFNTLRSSLSFGSGTLPSQWNIQGRISKVFSDGYIDRARSTLYSGALSFAKVLPKRSFRLHIFDGLENTYQAWNGVPEQYINTLNRTFNTGGTERTAVPYENQIDRYRQTHFQFIYHEQINSQWSLANTFHLTPGNGYYEEYKANQNPVDYLQPGDKDVDLVRRRNLNNIFLGSIHSVKYSKELFELTGGASWNVYKGKHIGQIIQLNDRYLADKPEYYHYDAAKWTAMAFGKVQFTIKSITLLGDVQFRNVWYRYQHEQVNTSAYQKAIHHFINPKLGLTWQVNQDIQLYGSSGVAYREPNRGDYVDADQDLPKAERLVDHELGIRMRSSAIKFEQNFYFMNYKNQLIPTGRLNDVGSYVRSNVDHSYRLGFESSLSWALVKDFSMNANVNISKNITKEYTEYIDNWDNGSQEIIIHKNQPIAFSPSSIFNIELNWDGFEFKSTNHRHRLGFELASQSIGKQYLDGTGNKASLLPAFTTIQLKGNYNLIKAGNEVIQILFQINNLLNKDYESNGWIYRFISPSYNPVPDDPYSARESNNIYHQKGLFPQAGRHFLVGLRINIGGA
ncbi:MAG: TonB-dependent receptor [Saprospiraceae bacterium]